MNWTYYNSVYSSAEFTQLWDMFAYLNSRGITNGAFFNFMGRGPAWMMGSDGSLTAGMEAEWAEMITSLLVYARNTRGLQFNLVAPDNEPDIYNEGIHYATRHQYTSALHQLAQKLDANGLSDVRLVGPDLAGGGTGYMPEMMADPVIMAKLEHFGVHSYSAVAAARPGCVHLHSRFGLSRPHVLGDGVQRVVQHLRQRHARDLRLGLLPGDGGYLLAIWNGASGGHCVGGL